MKFKILFTLQANNDFEKLKKNKSHLKQCKAVEKCLGYLETNLRHPGLNTHKYQSFTGPNNEDIFEAYAQNNTAAAYRIFWHYGPNKNQITIIMITAHP